MEAKQCLAAACDGVAGRGPEAFEAWLPALAASPREFLGFVDRHGLSASLVAALKQRGAWESLPEGLRAPLSAQRLEEWSRSAALSSPMRELSTRLAAEGLEHLFLKGPLFAERCYGGSDRRRSTDIDLLVRDADLARAEVMLVGLGYARLARDLPGQAVLRRVTHHAEFARGPGLVELHWSLARHPGVRIPESALWQGASQQHFEGMAWPVPSLETTLLALVLGLATDVGLGAAKLRSLLDLRMTLLAFDRGTDWSSLAARFAAHGSLGIVFATLDLCFEVLGSEDARLAACRSALEEHRGPRLLRAARGDRDAVLAEAVALFETPPPAWANKQRVFRCLAPPSLACWAWWSSSLPWRIAAHRPA